jgi:hypothetical protein
MKKLNEVLRINVFYYKSDSYLKRGKQGRFSNILSHGVFLIKTK